MNRSEQKKHGYTYRREDLYTCIVFLIEDMPWNETEKPKPLCLKYRNIPVDKPASLERFKNFICVQYPTAKYFNVYGGLSGDYYKRVYF